MGDILLTLQARQSLEDATVIGVRLGDPLPVRHYLYSGDGHNEDLSFVLDPTQFQLWIISNSIQLDATIPNWFGVPFYDAAPYKGDCEFTLTVKMMQPMHEKARTRLGSVVALNKVGRFSCDVSRLSRDNRSFLMNLVKMNLVAVVQEWTHNSWDPPVRVAGMFGRFLTNSHDYVGRHHQTRIRVLFHKSMMIPATAAEAEGLEIGDSVVFSDDEAEEKESDSGIEREPDDLVVSPDLGVFFKGQANWIAEGSRKNLDKFIRTHMGQRDNGTYRLVNSGYAQYLVPQILPSHRF